MRGEKSKKLNLANKITLARILMIPLFLIAFYTQMSGSNLVAAFIFAVAAISDSLDGYIARSRDQITTLGKFMDPIADKLLVMTAVVMLVSVDRLHPLIAVVFIAREFIISGLRLVAVSQGIVIAASNLAKAKTLTQMIAVVVLLLDNLPFSLLGIPVDQICVWASLIFTLWSAIDYVVRNGKVLYMSETGNFRTPE